MHPKHFKYITFINRKSKQISLILCPSGCPQDTAHLLSSQDMELLRRWTSMQNPVGSGPGTQDSGSNSNSNSSPPHPGPSVSPAQGTVPTLDRSNSCSSLGHSSGIAFVGQGTAAHQVLAKAGSASSLPVTLNTPLRFSSAENTSGATVFIPSSQLGALGQANFIPVLAIPSTITPGKVEIKRILPQQQQQKRQLKPASIIPANSQDTAAVSTHSNQAASESTRSLLQNVLRERNQCGISQTNFSNLSSSGQTPVNNTSSSSTASRFDFTITTDTREQLNVTAVSDTSCNDESPVLTALSNHFPDTRLVGMPSSNPKSNQDLTASTSTQESGLSPLGSAGTDFMEFLDQLKDSSIKLKLASAGSTASLKSPPLSAFGQNSAGLPSHHESQNSSVHVHTELHMSGTQAGGSIPSQDNCTLNQHTINLAAVGHEQELPRPERSSLPFLSYSQESPEQHPPRPSRSSVPKTSYASSHSNNLQEQNLNSFPFTGFGSGNISTQQTSFPLSNYADSFIDASQHKDFPSPQNLQQPQHQQQQMNFSQSSGMLFPASNFSPMHNAYSQQQNTADQKSQQISYIHSQHQQHQDHLLYSYPLESSATSSSSFLQHPQNFDGNFAGFGSTPHQAYSHPHSEMSQLPLDPQMYGSSQLQQQNNVLKPQTSTTGEYFCSYKWHTTEVNWM